MTEENGTENWNSLKSKSFNTLSVLIFASLNFRGNKISRELIREIREKNAKSAKFNSREIRKEIGIREIREI